MLFFHFSLKAPLSQIGSCLFVCDSFYFSIKIFFSLILSGFIFVLLFSHRTLLQQNLYFILSLASSLSLILFWVHEILIFDHFLCFITFHINYANIISRVSNFMYKQQFPCSFWFIDLFLTNLTTNMNPNLWW